MTKFVANNNKSAFTKLFPFFATKSFYPYISFVMVDLSNTSTREQILKQKALDISEKIETFWEFAWKALIAAQES